ncbi:hypothetical protein [Streptomyces sp. NPDC056600]|uniref:hypothetical protein n=1 Tax=Streptomyces sp. NPDC056600 TaxID=3345874 RepID=UPI0036792D30
MTGLLLLGGIGCEGVGGDGEDVPDQAVAGTELCGGDAMSAEASRALKVITGSSRFEASGEEYSVEQAAALLAEAWPSSVIREDVCRIYTAADAPDFELRVTWSLVDGPPTGRPAAKYTPLKMGERAGAAADKAYVQFECRSNRFGTAEAEAHIFLSVERGGMPVEPEGDVEALKDAYATVAHSVSLAMAKELRCENNGGLPERPVLDPA